MIRLFDIMIFTIITASSMFGIYSGALKLTINLLGFLLSIFSSYLLYPYIMDIINTYFDNELVVTIISWIISYIIALVICTFCTHKFISIVSNISGGVIDRFLGLLIGLLRGGIICSILFFIIAIFTSNSYFGVETLEDVAKNTNMDKYPEWREQSLTISYLDNITKKIIMILPKDILKSTKLFKESEIIDINNMSEAAHSSKQALDDHRISEDLQYELDAVLPL